MFNLPDHRTVQPGMRYITLAALVIAQTLAGHAQTAATVDGSWTAELHSNRVYLQLRATPPDEARNDRGDRAWDGWNMGQTMSVEDVGGLPANDEHFTVSNVKLELRREAGTLALDGAFRDGRGAGLFTFTPRAQFTSEMKALGFSDELPLWRRFQLAVHDVGPTYVRALKGEGYDKLSLDQIQRAKTHGVSIDYIKSMKAEGYKVTEIEDIVRTRDHGVTAEYVRGMRTSGFKDATFADLVRAKDHGVTPDFAKELRDQGINPSTLDGFVRMRDHGIRGPFVVELKKAGFNSARSRRNRARQRPRRQRRIHRRHERHRPEEPDAQRHRPSARSRRDAGVRKPRPRAGLQGRHRRRPDPSEGSRDVALIAVAFHPHWQA